ncbi:hypothetical protein VNO77_37386 [Canavalia gladiata]|uniref:Proton pump-interactor 1 n=1 Tax=Canavalia gladiata TaxID=3824 RepID=A0AAN9PUR8_CANGL
MSVEVVGFEMVEGPVENSDEGEKSISQENENEKLEQDAGAEEPIKFGSHEDEESAKAEENVVSDSNVPKDAVEEWPAPKQIHSFYFVRFRTYDDPNIKPKLDKLDREISQRNQVRIQLTDAVRAKRSERSELISQIKALRDDNRQFQSIVDEKLKEIEPLQQALGKLRSTNNAGRGGLCSSEEELDNIIYSLQYRMQHESIPLAEEKQILREIKQLEGTREKVIANAAMRAKVQDSLGQKEAIQDQVKLIGGDLDGVKKERQVIRSKIKQLDDALKALDQDIQSLSDELGAVIQKREKAYESIQQLRKQRDEGNSNFYQSRAILNKARELAAKKDINALEELSQTEVERVMSLWNSDKSFRNDYEKRLLPSLDMRQLSRDGRMRNPDEKPLLEEPKPAETDTLPKSIVKQPKEDSKPHPQETKPIQKVQKETKKKGRDHKDLEDDDEYGFEISKPKETPVKEPAIDPEKLKEMKREEEIAKAKQALERKKKLAEKAAAKAAIRAQKEAEKKLKEREKKAKKAASTSAGAPNPEEPANEAVDVIELEKTTDNASALAPAKEKVQKESSVKSRNRAKAMKGPESIPKAILRRKRSQNYWVWVASGALLVLVLLVLGYNLLS